MSVDTVVGWVVINVDVLDNGGVGRGDGKSAVTISVVVVLLSVD